MADAKDNLSQSLGFFNVLTASEDEEADEKTKKRSRENKLLDVGNETPKSTKHVTFLQRNDEEDLYAVTQQRDPETRGKNVRFEGVTPKYESQLKSSTTRNKLDSAKKKVSFLSVLGRGKCRSYTLPEPSKSVRFGTGIHLQQCPKDSLSRTRYTKRIAHCPDIQTRSSPSSQLRKDSIFMPKAATTTPPNRLLMRPRRRLIQRSPASSSESDSDCSFVDKVLPMTTSAAGLRQRLGYGAPKEQHHDWVSNARNQQDRQEATRFNTSHNGAQSELTDDQSYIARSPRIKGLAVPRGRPTASNGSCMAVKSHTRNPRCENSLQAPTRQDVQPIIVLLGKGNEKANRLGPMFVLHYNTDSTLDLTKSQSLKSRSIPLKRSESLHNRKSSMPPSVIDVIGNPALHDTVQDMSWWDI